MATNIQKRSEYTIRGRVIDRVSQSGVRGVRVEAWDRDTRYHDLLGQAVTDELGTFGIGFGSDHFGDYAPDRAPDVFFKVFLDGREVLSTFDRALKNSARGDLDVKLELDMPQLQPRGRDRISAQQTLKAVDWWRASDFRGTWREGTDKLGTVGRLVGDLAARSFGNFDFEPVRPKGTREREVVDQDVQHAQRALALQQVEVVEVRPMADTGRGAQLRQMKDYPLNLQPGERVVLHTRDDKVMYYTRVSPTDAGNVDGQTVARIDGDVQSLKAQLRGMDDIRADLEGLKATDTTVEQRVGEASGDRRAQAEEFGRLKRELTDVRKAAAAKDVEIAQLRTDLTAVRTAQDNLTTRLPLDRLDALEAQIRRLAGGGSIGPSRAPTAAAAVRAAAVRKAPAAGSGTSKTAKAKPGTSKPRQAKATKVTSVKPAKAATTRKDKGG